MLPGSKSSFRKCTEHGGPRGSARLWGTWVQEEGENPPVGRQQGESRLPLCPSQS